MPRPAAVLHRSGRSLHLGGPALRQRGQSWAVMELRFSVAVQLRDSAWACAFEWRFIDFWSGEDVWEGEVRCSDAGLEDLKRGR